jgi:hypothetical protein
MTLAKIVAGKAVVFSPAEDVFFNGLVASYETVTKWSEVERNAIGIYTVAPASPPPQGKMLKSIEVGLVNGKPAEIATYADAPKRTLAKSVIIKRLNDAGKLAAAIALLDQPENLYARERWRSADWSVVNADDPDLIAVLQAIGANVGAITA